MVLFCLLCVPLVAFFFFFQEGNIYMMYPTVLFMGWLSSSLVLGLNCAFVDAVGCESRKPDSVFFCFFL